MEDFEVVNYFDDDYQEYWRNEIRRGDWDGCQKLFEILNAGKFKEVYGEGSKLYLVTDGESLICFCAFMEKNESVDGALNPWIGYVYTFKEYRGNGYMGELIEQVLQENGGHAYVATLCNGLYEKYGFDFVSEKETSEGTKRIYRK